MKEPKTVPRLHRIPQSQENRRISHARSALAEIAQPAETVHQLLKHAKSSVRIGPGHFVLSPSFAQTNVQSQGRSTFLSTGRFPPDTIVHVQENAY
jgi:hypothetical protein